MDVKNTHSVTKTEISVFGRQALDAERRRSPSLADKVLRGDQIEVFKILNGYENIDSNIFFEIKESKITRGHNYTLVKKQSRLDVRKFSFSQRTINIWNNLSTDCVHASSVNMFKNKIDKYLVKAGYT